MTLDQLLRSDLGRLLDRIATSEGAVHAAAGLDPEARRASRRPEARLAAAQTAAPDRVRGMGAGARGVRRPPGCLRPPGFGIERDAGSAGGLAAQQASQPALVRCRGGAEPRLDRGQAGGIETLPVVGQPARQSTWPSARERASVPSRLGRVHGGAVGLRKTASQSGAPGARAGRPTGPPSPRDRPHWPPPAPGAPPSGARPPASSSAAISVASTMRSPSWASMRSARFRGSPC